MNEEEKYGLILTVKKINGKCPVFKVGDQIVIDSPKIILDRTDNLCIHAIGSIISIVIPLSYGISFKQLGLTKEDAEKGYVQCLDPGKPYTDGGTVLFEIKRKRN